MLGGTTAAPSAITRRSRRATRSPSRRARARLDLIYAYYKSRESESAVDAADQFIRENPTHPRVDYALYIKGLIYFERTPNFLERWFRTDLTERPPQDVRRSFQAFQTLIERFPNSEYAHDARQRMIFLRNRLADYEVHVADYYLRRGLRRRDRARALLHRELRRRAVGAGCARHHDLRLRGLGMDDLAEHSREVYAMNYPGSTPERRAAKRAWWKLW